METKSPSKIRILNILYIASLIVRGAKISPGVLLAHARMLSKTTAKSQYPLTRIEVKTFYDTRRFRERIVR